MIYNKKGLSTVVTTLIIILLVLVAIGIIWIVVRGVMEGGAEDINYSTKCMDVDVRPTNSTCTTTTCTVTLSRKARGEAISGVKLVFFNGPTSSSVFDTKSYGITNIDPLTSKVTDLITHGFTTVVPTRVTATPYFIDSAGAEQVCPQTSEYKTS